MQKFTNGMAANLIPGQWVKSRKSEWAVREWMSVSKDGLHEAWRPQRR